MVEPVVIVGAGLSGLTSAYVLWQHNIPSLILEARDRIGGRIFTERSDSFHTEMGATWLGPQHTVLISLLEQLEVTKFVQSYDGKSIVDYGPSHPPYFFSSNPGDPPTYRIVNGSATLIDHLLKVSSPKLSLGSEVKSIKYLGDTVLIITDEDQFEAEFLVNTIPPKLTRRSISFEPELNDDVLKKMEETHTWMSNSIKFSVRYKEPFWRSQGLSGCIMSQGGAVTEMYDHTTASDKAFGLKGFLSESLRVHTKSERKKIVLEYLSRFYGETALDCIEYFDKDWSEDTCTTTPDFLSIQQHPVYDNQIFQQPIMGGRLILSGTETSPHYPGYMEGAVYAGIRSAQQIIHTRSDNKG